MTFTLAVVSAGLSQPSSTRLLADRLVESASRQLRSAGHDVLVEVVELRPLAHALADNLVTGFPNAELEAAISTVTRADALVAVTPIFTASYSGLFKTFFDVLDKDALAGKPTLVAATEDFGATSDGRLGERVDRAAAELVALLAPRATGSQPAEPAEAEPTDLDEVTPFEQLLRGL